MCRTGGPRCDGSRRAQTTTAAAPAGPSAAAAAGGQTPKGSGNVPGRERTDELAAKLPADRKGWDGKPLNERDRRFFALRESGYTGPIDQDGYPDTASDGAATLRYMAEQRGETVDW